MEEGLHITLKSERLFEIAGIPISNTLMTAWVVMFFLFLVAFLVRKNLSLVPGRLQNAIEMGFEYVYGYVRQTLGSDKLAARYFPLIFTIFVFMLLANLLDLVPIFGTVGIVREHELVPLFHPVNADLNTPLSFAIISFLVAEISGIMTLGVLKYGSKFVNLRGGVMGFIIGLLEIIGNLARLISLSFRLFGTIFAGEVLLLVIGYFVPYILPVPLMAFELFIGFLQAAIFAILTLAYIKLAVEEPHGSGSHEHKEVAAH